MGSVPMNRTKSTSVEAILGDELARADRALLGVAPVISHLLDASGEALVNDAILARLRGMLAHLSRSLLGADRPTSERGSIELDTIDSLSEELARDPALLRHLYALAVEGLVTERLERTLSFDPVLSPLLQELIASDQPATAELAIKALTAQSRYLQSQGRMELELNELPADLFANVLELFEGAAPQIGVGEVSSAIAQVQRGYDEGASRIGLFARLVAGLRNGALAGLSLEHAGFPLFASCLANLSGQPRDLVVLSSHERQNARLVLSLRAAGLEGEEIERQLQILGPASPHADNIANMPSERAREMLAQSNAGDAFMAGAA